MLNIQDHIKNAADGSFDKKATLASASKALRAMVSAYAAQQEKPGENAIESEVDRVFDSVPEGEVIKTSVLVFRILKGRGDTEGAGFAGLQKEVVAFIRSSARFQTLTGRNVGGVKRVAAPEAAPVSGTNVTDTSDEDADDSEDSEESLEVEVEDRAAE